MGQQQSAELRPPLLRCLMEGSERPLVCGVDAGVELDQQGGDIHVLDRGEEVEGRKEGRREGKEIRK